MTGVFCIKAVEQNFINRRTRQHCSLLVIAWSVVSEVSARAVSLDLDFPVAVVC